MTRLFATEGVAAGANCLENVAVAHFGLDHFDVVFFHGDLEAEVAHHSGNQSVAGQLAACLQRKRKDGHDLVTIDDCTGVVDCKAAVGVAVVGDAKVCAVLKNRGLQGT